ncbi:MAG: helix-hairpin-helix domain-containing protein [Oscillospiraceae bacterium]|nr:helix-hairpin-helix domain-containing protein [Oscillospiraceae bacterium]
MLVFNKRAKVVFGIALFALIVAAGFAVELFEKDAFIMETVAEDDGALYQSEGEGVVDGKININSAQSEELEELNGIGEALAGRIIKYREENGPFASIEEITKVSGISEKKFEAIKDYICAE